MAKSYNKHLIVLACVTIHFLKISQAQAFEPNSINNYKSLIENKKTCKNDTECNAPFLICDIPEKTTLSYSTQDNNFTQEPKPEPEKTGKCAHKDVFPQEPIETIGTIIVQLISILALSTGLSVGILYVPLTMIFFGQTAHEAIPLSNGLIFFNSIMRYFISINEAHPYASGRSIIDFNVSILQNPVLMLGSAIGVIINVLQPESILLMILCFTLLMSGIFGMTKSIKMYQEENLDYDKYENQIVELELNEIIDIDKYRASINYNQEIRANSEISSRSKNDQILQELALSDVEIVFPYHQMIWIIACFCISCIMPLVTSNYSEIQEITNLLIEKCDSGYFMVWGFYLICILYFWVRGAKLIQEHHKQLSNDFAEDDQISQIEQEIHWDNKTILTTSLYIFLISIYSTVVGIGGGIYMVPTLQSLGYLPEIVGSTSIFMVFWSKLITLVWFFLNKNILVGLTQWLGIIQQFGSWFSLMFLKVVTRKILRQSYVSIGYSLVTLGMSGLMVIGTAMFVLGGLGDIGLWKFGDFC